MPFTALRPRVVLSFLLAIAAHVFAPAVACAQPAVEDPPVADDEARLLRFPHLQGDRVVFVYGGDLWTCPARGGEAHRLTSFDEGVELSPRISPDGRLVAFSGEYTGSRQVFVVPYEGGVPRQLTWYPDVGQLPPRGGYDNLVLDWTPDGSRILVLSNRTPYGERIGRYFLVDPQGRGLETPLQLPEGAGATFSPDGTKLAYNIISREWRTWKRYRAGRAQDVWLYDLAADAIERVTEFDGTDNHPMWLGDRVYFTSDRLVRADGTIDPVRCGRLNLFVRDASGGDIRQVTRFDDFDVLFPARGRGGIVFEKGGFLYVMEEGTEEVRRLQIRLADDRPWLRPKWLSGKGNVASYDISPSANRVVVEVRGDLFTVPKEKGEPRPVTETPDRRERDVRWSPDGTRLAYLAEVGEDYELFVRDLVEDEERQLTRDSDAWILDHAWSPDAKSIAFTDKANRLRVADAADGAVRDLDRNDQDAIRQVSWSADSRFVTYVKRDLNEFDSVWVCDVASGSPVRVTSERFDDGSPCFDPAGEYLYFVSSRDFDYGSLDFRSRLYAVILKADGTSPLAPESDEEPAVKPAAAADETKAPDGDEEDDGSEAKEDAGSAASDDEDAADEKKEDAKKDAPKPVRVDADAILERVVALPSAPGGYGNLTGVKGGFLFVQGNDLKKYDVAARKVENVLDGVTGYMVTADLEKLVYRRGQDLCIAKVAPGQKAGEDAIPLDRVSLRLDPRTEWQQIYADAWRIMRDWFYDPGMHGVDWRAMRDRYADLVDHVAHRDDLDFLMGELIGELNCGHTYVSRGDSPRVTRIDTGVLGCELVAEGERYRITRIYPGRAWVEDARSPLADPGVDAREGEFLIAIDGHDVTTADNPYRFLENMAGRQVTLTLNAAPTADGAREVVVRPARSEVNLRYLAWVERNEALVADWSDGRIGYIHVPDTGAGGHEAFYQGFRALARVKDALIVDDRYNGGGNIPDRMIDALDSPVLNWWARRSTELSPTPDFAFDGPMTMLINGYSSSGGDAFPYYFRERGLGPLIGRRTWGGLVGYSGSPALVDGGSLAVPAFAFVDREGNWDVEAVGVAPDIEVFDDPARLVRGEEPVLRAAVDHLLERLAEAPPLARPPVPPGPDRH